MGTPSYEQIREKVLADAGIKIHRTCYIAEVFRSFGLTKRTSWNSGKGRGSPQCPEKTFKAIEAALRDFEAIP